MNSKKVYLGIFVGFIIALLLYQYQGLSFPQKKQSKVPQPYEFSLANQKHQPFGTKELRGKIWVASFIFTRCRGTCPIITHKLAAFRKILDKSPILKEIVFVSFSVDPTYDTSHVLSEYAKKYDVENTAWQFLTGTRTTIWNLSKVKFNLPVGKAPENKVMPIFHSSNLVVVDRYGKIQGHFNGLDDTSYTKLKSKLASLAQKPYKSKDVLVLGKKNISQQVDNYFPKWLSQRQKDQKKQAPLWKVFHGFSFSNTVESSQISFRHQIVDDAGQRYKAVHYDHGNGVAAADIDNDGLQDLYFLSFLGSNELWKNVGNGKFVNHTNISGTGLSDMISVGASFADIDNDGDNDLFVTTVRKGNVLFLNDGKGSFTNISQQAGVNYHGHSSGAVFFDFDRDGLLDLLLCNVGKYTTEKKGRGDYYVGHKRAFSNHLIPEYAEESILYKNLNGRKFKNVSQQVGFIDKSWNGDAIVTDINEDGWPDIYLLNMQGEDQYFENNKGVFVKKTPQFFPKTPWGSMGGKAFDYNNDGKQEIYVTDMHIDMAKNIKPSLSLEREKVSASSRYPQELLATNKEHIWGNAFFHFTKGQWKDISQQVNLENYWPWGICTGDLNADGYEDIFVTASMNFGFRYATNLLLLNENGQSFRSAEFVLGVEPRAQITTPWFAIYHPNSHRAWKKMSRYMQDEFDQTIFWGVKGSRSALILDFDNDGDLDIVTNEFGERPMVLTSNLSQTKKIHFLKVNLQGSSSNRNGLGAKVTVFTENYQYTKFHDGKSYLSQSIIPIYFGLAEPTIKKVEVLWPSGKRQVIDKVIANTTIKIHES